MGLARLFKVLFLYKINLVVEKEDVLALEPLLNLHSVFTSLAFFKFALVTEFEFYSYLLRVRCIVVSPYHKIFLIYALELFTVLYKPLTHRFFKWKNRGFGSLH